MRIKLLILILTVNFSSCSNNKEKLPIENIWTDEMAKRHIANREDSSKWDWKIFESDLMSNTNNLGLLFSSGVFPVPKYDILVVNSFNGVGNFGYPGGEGLELKIDNKTILFNSFFVGVNAFNENYVGENKKDEVFFHIVILTDFIDTTNYSHLLSEIISRNHPDYIGQGFYKTKKNKIDYTAFITADRNAYAIINMRLFDLKYGKTILITPQQDGSIRSLQIKSPILSKDEIENYTKGLLEKENIKMFFMAKGNI